MGVKRVLTQKDLPEFININTLTHSTNGVSDSVYFWKEDKILKIYESASLEHIQNEIILLEHLNILCVPQVKTEVFFIQNTPALVFQRRQGKSVQTPKDTHIKQIAQFLKRMHHLTKKQKSNNTPLYDKARLHELIQHTKDKTLLHYFHTIKITLQHDGIIHGDLFKDNAVFKDETLFGVFDFIEACEGDFLFDVAVVALDWCFEKNLNIQKLETLLSTYDASLKVAIIIPFIQYALLYYATLRTLEKRDARVLLKKLESLFDDKL